MSIYFFYISQVPGPIPGEDKILFVFCILLGQTIKSMLSVHRNCNGEKGSGLKGKILAVGGIACFRVAV